MKLPDLFDLFTITAANPSAVKDRFKGIEDQFEFFKYAQKALKCLLVIIDENILWLKEPGMERFEMKVERSDKPLDYALLEKVFSEIIDEGDNHDA